MADKSGYIYILTNPSFPEYVKIGYADDVEDCTVRNWSIQETRLATSKKEAKRYAAYLVLCNYYRLPDEFVEEDE